MVILPRGVSSQLDLVIEYTDLVKKYIIYDTGGRKALITYQSCHEQSSCLVVMRRKEEEYGYVLLIKGALCQATCSPREITGFIL